jgi:hypothetical protein
MTVAQVVRCGLAAAASLCVLSGAAKEKDTKTGSAPKAGIKTPGVQIPFSSLKAESDFATEGTRNRLRISRIRRNRQSGKDSDSADRAENQ